MEGRSGKRVKSAQVYRGLKQNTSYTFTGFNAARSAEGNCEDGPAYVGSPPLTEANVSTGHEFSWSPINASTTAKRKASESGLGGFESDKQYPSEPFHFDFGRLEDCEDFLSIDLHAMWPDLFPQTPGRADQRVADALSNPFAEGGTQVISRYDVANRAPAVVPSDGKINGYVKFTISSRSGVHRKPSEREVRQGVQRRENGMHHRNPLLTSGPSASNVVLLPSQFGSASILDYIDRELLKFYQFAFCRGRTLLPATNVYVDIMTMADCNEGVQHCALALAAGYLLDYSPNDAKLRARANHHYGRAIELLSADLADSSVQEVGKEDAVVGSLILLFSEDIVNWELRQHCNKDPAWRRASKTAKTILDNSDPGCRYWHSENVQSSKVRKSNANMVAYVEVCVLPLTPLNIEDTQNLFGWLLEGSERDVTEIHGGTGLSPKLLHIFTQITQLSARMAENPTSIVIPLAAEEIERRLATFKQWSTLSEGFDSIQKLFASCDLDDKGLVSNPASVTDLTAETWVQAARIYLYCRFYRMPRYGTKVQESLGLLLRCVERMPTSGELFTAQSPFFCIFLAGLVAFEPGDREVISAWFNSIVTSARSSVPPIWRTLKEYWVWIDKQPFASRPVRSSRPLPLGQRESWWEIIVERFVETEGQLSLC